MKKPGRQDQGGGGEPGEQHVGHYKKRMLPEGVQ